MDINTMKGVEELALITLGTTATVSLVVRVLIVVFLDDLFEIVERYYKHKRRVEKGEEL